MTGEWRVDLHVKVLTEGVVDRAKRRGLDALVYAPHFTRLPAIDARTERFSDDDLLVVPGREVFTGSWRHRKHVLALGLTDPVPDFLTLDGTMAELARQDATVLVPHPEYGTVSLDRREIRQYRDQIVAVETDNPKHLPFHTRRARTIVRESGIPPFGSSYAHLPGTVGEIWTAFESPIGSSEDLITALESGAPRRVERRSGPAHLLRRGAELAHLFWENSIPKADRVLLRGLEPTHPGRAAYDGRFEADRVY